MNQTKLTPTPVSPVSESQRHTKLTVDVLQNNYGKNTSEYDLSSQVLTAINVDIEARNSILPKGQKLRMLTDIPNIAIAIMIAVRPDVALIAPGDKSQTGRKMRFSAQDRTKFPIGIYREKGDFEGVWEVSNDPFGAFGMLVERYKMNATRNEKKEIFTLVKGRAQVREMCTVPYYVPVNNGIFDVLHKKLLPFTKDLVFTSKILTNLNPAATNPVIAIPEDGTTWDVDSWLNSLGNPDFVGSIKEVIQAACLPLVSRDKMVLFFNKSGNNGKGTICQLIRNLLGEESTVSIPLKDFSTPFGLTNLPGALAVITDENDVCSYNKGNAVLKAVITGDQITVERKYQDPYDYTFRGLVLECVNDFPNGDDKSGSFRRRLHIIQFEQCFSGAQKRYIKDRLIYRDDVLEYILKMVLMDMPYREAFTETAATKQALDLYVASTNSVVSFLDEILPLCKWDLLPATDFLYEAYKAWYKKISPSGKVIGRNDFIDGVKDYIDALPNSDWEWTDCTRSQGYINCNICEPLLTEYNLVGFQNKNAYYDSCHRMYPDPKRIKEKYSGLKRRFPTVALGSGSKP